METKRTSPELRLEQGLRAFGGVFLKNVKDYFLLGLSLP